jgi:hypothetical protein
LKYYSLHIDFPDSQTTFDKVSNILEVDPLPHTPSKLFPSVNPNAWQYLLQENESKHEPCVDFINIFLDILEPKLHLLKEIGITSKNILFWLNYEFQEQCALSFPPQEMERLGKSGIHLNIDCFGTYT